MRDYISFDSHKHYTLCEIEDRRTGRARQFRIEHGPGVIREFLCRHAEPGTPVAVEAIGNWYWIIDEIEQAGMRPVLVHPRKAKLMMGMINITSALAKYGLQLVGASDPYGKRRRRQLEFRLARLPEQTRAMNALLLEQLDSLDVHIDATERRIRRLVERTPEMLLLKTLPGIGNILAAAVCLEIGDIDRFASAERLASYAGTTPRVHSSGGKTRYGRLRPDVNRYLRWAFVEAANSVAVHHKRRPERHVSQLYLRIRQRRGHAKAVGAVARHLAEATYHVWTRQEPYRDPALKKGLSQGGESADAS